MKKSILITFLLIISLSTWAQQNRITLSGGYVFANIEDFDVSANGWRVNGLYEFVPNEGKIAHGLSFGYLSTSSLYFNLASQTINWDITSMPLYYAPKYMFGNESLRGFVKGALGVQWSTIKRTGSLGELKTNDSGIYTGASVGVMKNLGEKALINFEYEWAYMSNTYYRDGFINSIMLGFGYKI